MMRKNENKGITLIALVITIIILLIIVGVTIGILTRDNGILGKTEQAKTENEKQTATEIMNLKITNAQMASYVENSTMPTLQYLADRLCEDNEMEYVLKESQKSAKLNEKIKVENTETIFTKLEDYPYEFEINGDLKLASIDGITIADNKTNSEDMVSREEYNALLKKVETLEKQSKNIDRTILMNTPFTIPVTQDWVEKDFGDIPLADSIENYKYLEIQFEEKRTASGMESKYGWQQYTSIIATEQYNYNNSNNRTAETAEITLVAPFLDDNESIAWGWFKSNKILHIAGARTHSGYEAIIVKKIYGIN